MCTIIHRVKEELKAFGGGNIGFIYNYCVTGMNSWARLIKNDFFRLNLSYLD